MPKDLRSNWEKHRVFPAMPFLWWPNDLHRFPLSIRVNSLQQNFDTKVDSGTFMLLLRILKQAHQRPSKQICSICLFKAVLSIKH